MVANGKERGGPGNREGRGTSLVIKLILTNSAKRKLFVAVRLKRVRARVPPKAFSRWGPHSSSEVSSNPLKHAARPSTWRTNAATKLLFETEWVVERTDPGPRVGGKKRTPARRAGSEPTRKKNIMKTILVYYLLIPLLLQNRAFPVRLPVSPDWVIFSGLFFLSGIPSSFICRWLSFKPYSHPDVGGRGVSMSGGHRGPERSQHKPRNTSAPKI